MISSAEQLALFDVGVDLARLRQAREVLMNAGKSENTRSAYASGWKHFASWCSRAGRCPLPSTPETVGLFAAALLENRYRLQTIRVKLLAIADRHAAAVLPSPVDASVRMLVSNAARVIEERPQPKAAVTLEHVRKLASRFLFR